MNAIRKIENKTNQKKKTKSALKDQTRLLTR
jgi:hypothetical protein